MIQWTVADPLPETLSPEDRDQLANGAWFDAWMETGPFTFVALNKSLALGDMLGWSSPDISPVLHDIAPSFKMPEFEKLLDPFNHMRDDGASEEDEDKAISTWKRMTGCWRFRGYGLEKLDSEQCAALARWIDYDRRRASCLFKRAGSETVLAVVLEARRAWKPREYSDDESPAGRGRAASRDSSPKRK